MIINSKIEYNELVIINAWDRVERYCDGAFKLSRSKCLVMINSGLMTHETKIIVTIEVSIFQSCLEMHGSREKCNILNKIPLVHTTKFETFGRCIDGV